MEIKRKSVTILLGLLGLVVLGGCMFSSSNNPQSDWVLIPDSTARSIGKASAERLEKQVGIYDSDTYTGYIDNVGSRISVYSTRPALDYEFKILDTFMSNALALPGGFIYVTRGLLRDLETEAQLAAVIAHELGHVSAYHAVKRSQLKISSILVAMAAAGRTGGRSLAGGIMGSQMIGRGYSRSAEYQADKLGFEFTSKAGYHPRALVQFLKFLQEENKLIPVRKTLILRTHPFLEDRIKRLKLMLTQVKDSKLSNKIINRGRYARYRRKFLYTPREEEVLARFKEFINAYEARAPGKIKNYLGDSFTVGAKKNGDTEAGFIDSLEKRFTEFDRLEYTHKLLKTESSDTSITIVYSYAEKRWRADKKKPVLVDGYQKMFWKREDKKWFLVGLR